MKALEAARLIATTRATQIAYFTKRTDGTTRRMVFRYDGAPFKSGLVRVFDIEKGAYRTINLSGLQSLKALRPDRPRQVTSEERKAKMDEISALFG